MLVHSKAESSQGIPESAPEICTEKSRLVCVLEERKGLGAKPVKGANCRRAVGMAPTLPLHYHKDPTIHLCATSQDA